MKIEIGYNLNSLFATMLRTAANHTQNETAIKEISKILQVMYSNQGFDTDEALDATEVKQ